MPKFEKIILKEGKFRQWNEQTKEYEYVTVDKARLDKLEQSFQKITKKHGMKVPAPWKHDLDMTILTSGDGGLLAKSTDNAGFWESLKVQKCQDGKYGLVGIIESPGAEDDPNTPAGKIGSIVKDTSIYTRRNVPLTSGGEEVIDEAIMHIALVTHPIENGQENFQLRPDDAQLIMSNMVEDEKSETESESEETEDTVGGASISQLVNDLRDIYKLYLPTTTTIDNLIENLSIAVNQYKLLNSEASPETETFEVEPLLMSHLSVKQIEALISSKTVNPDTGKPYEKADFKVDPVTPQVDTQSQLIMSAMQNSMQTERRKGYRSRVDALVKSNRTTQAFADSNLYPQADSYNLEFSNGQVVTPVVETLLMALEAMPEPTVVTDASKQFVETLVMGSDWQSENTDNNTQIENIAKRMAARI